MKRLMQCFLLSALATTCWAQPSQKAEATAMQAIVAQQKLLRPDIEARRSHPHLTTRERRMVLEAQNRIFALAEGRVDHRDLNADDQLELFNLAEKIDAILVESDEDQRMVCERVAIAGTRRYQMACMTEAERASRAESARTAMMERAGCTTQACKGGD